MKKTLITVMCVLLSVFLLASCGTPAPAAQSAEGATETTPVADGAKTEEKSEVPAAEAPKDGEPITLKIAMWEPYEEEKSHVIASKKYTELTGIEFEWICVTDGYDQKMMTMTAGGNAPDLIQFWNTPQYVEAGIVQNIQDLVERDNFFPEGKYGIVEGFETYKGEYYGLATEATPRAIYYNKDIFDAVGVPYPKDGWTWDEFYETAKKLTQGEGENQTFGYVALADHIYLMQQYVWSNGSDFISEDGTTTIGYIDSPQTKEMIKWYKSLYDISAQVIQGDQAKNLGEAEFMSGKVAMMDNGIWPTWKLEEANINYGVVSPPVPKSGDTFIPVIHSGAYGISPNSKYKEECWEFMKFVQSEQGQEAYAVTSLPLLKQVSEKVGQTKNPHLEPFLNLLNVSEYKIPCFVRNKNWGEAEAVLALAVEEILLMDADIDATLNKAAQDTDAILKAS